MKPWHVVLVEDSPTDEALIVRALKKSALADKITILHDGAEALDYFSRVGDGIQSAGDNAPSFLLLDLSLPKIGGLEVIRRLRATAETKRLPIIILTSSDDRGDVVAAHEAGANSYVRKPLAYDEFADAIRQIEHYWLLLNHAVP